MKEHNINSYTRGWICGFFDPSIIKTEHFECAIQKYKKGAYEKRHTHKIATELTYIASGRAKMNGVVYESGSLIELEPGDSTDFEALEDTVNFVIKVPSVKGDKYEEIST